MFTCRYIKTLLEHYRCFVSSTKLSRVDLNWDHYCNNLKIKDLVSDIEMRRISCDINFIVDELSKLQDHCKIYNDENEINSLKEKLLPFLERLPNETHPHVLQNRSMSPIVLEKVGRKHPFSYFPTSFSSLTKKLNTLRTKNLGHMSGNKSYFLKSDMAALEQALIRFAVATLLKKGFTLVSVPDILPKSVFEGCGMKTEGGHSQVYHIDQSWGQDLCLSGTAEMALAALLKSKNFNIIDLPLKFCSVSRCYRAEANRHQKEKGIFRVHHFTKVEMFGVTGNESGIESENLHKEFIDIQKEIFSELGLHFQVVEMPSCDLGLPAYHKVDIETWIPTQKLYGEISSCSNCTDYQSRRLNIRYISNVTNGNNTLKHCHTVNGTACAIPRLLITIFENFQALDGSINIPKPLQKYMKKDIICKKFVEPMVCMKPTP